MEGCSQVAVAEQASWESGGGGEVGEASI
jgi:hypothetical protein